MADRRAPGLAVRLRKQLGRTPLGVAKRRVLRQSAWPASQIEDVAGEPQPLSDWRFFGVIGTWNEEDVVESCVRNAFTQGCEQVFLVDNASDDQTVERAIAGGAVHARTYVTQHYDEQLRIQLMQEVVESASRQSGAAHVWWLWLDADEFPHGRSGLTLRQQLQTLDRRFRVVGARWLNHWPSGTPQFRPGRHPLDYQPLAEQGLASGMCTLDHLKHPLQRWDAAGFKMASGLGFHRVHAARTVVEPRDWVITHHFPFRDEAVTRARLARLWEAGGRMSELSWVSRTDRLARYESIDAIYRGEWAKVVHFHTGTEGVHPRPWTELVDPGDESVDRWYGQRS